MNRACFSGTSMLAATLRRVLTLAIFIIAGLVCAPESMVAQGSFEASGRVTPSASSAIFFTDRNRGAGGLFSTNAIPGIPGTGPGIRAFGQPQTPSSALSLDMFPNPVAWNRWLMEPSQPWIGVGRFGGSAAGSIGFTGIGRQQGGGFDQIAGRGLGGPQMNFPPLFPETGTPTRNQMSGTAPGTLPRFDARTASSFILPFNSAAGGFRLSYREIFSGGRIAEVDKLGAGTGSAMFSTSNLGNGMFLSAGSTYGSRSTGGSPAGNSALAGQRHSGPSVGLKLTF
jgi:hypothetical protein